MAETDSRKIRPFGPTADRRDYESEEDPLLELARIVSEDSGFPGPRTERPKPVRQEPIDRNALSADLEAELLQELESSFAPRSPAPAPRAAPRPAPEPPADDADDLLRSIEAQLGEFERRTQFSHDTQPDEAERSEPARTPPSEPAFAPRAAEPRRNRATEPEVAAEPRWEEEPLPPPVAEDALPPPRPRERPAALRPTAWRDRPENSPAARAAVRPLRRPVAEPEPEQTPPPEQLKPFRAPLRRRDTPRHEGLSELPKRGALAAGATAGWSELSAADETQAPASEPRSWRESAAASDHRPELRTTFDDSPEPIRAADQDAERTDALEPSFADPTFGTEWSDGAETDADDTADTRVSPAGPLSDGRRTARGSARAHGSRKGLVAAAGVLGVLVLGGAVLALMRPGDEVPSGPPPVIAAPEGDVKVAAPQGEEPADGETVGEAVYNRVAGAAPTAEEQVVDGAEEPREISRIVLPPPQAESDEALVRSVGEAGDTPAADESVAANAGADDVVIGPRRVRTYVVRPDGTISAADAAPPPATLAPPPQQLAAVAATPIEPVRVATTAISAGQTAETSAPAAAPAPPPVAAEAEPDPVAPASTAAVPQAEPEPPAPPRVAAVQPAEAAPAPSAAQPEATDDAPVDLLSAAPAAPPAAAVPAGQGYLVQVSSQRSMAEAQASLASMQQRYSSILGNVPSDIQQADLGAKGIYYRVRVGPWASRAEAVELCESLQGAGGACFVTQ